MGARLEMGALQALCAIADHGGITRAAAHLALSQSAVSHKIRRLEESLACALLTRQVGGDRFTPEGERLLRYARRIVVLHDEAVTSLGRTSLSGRIRLGVTEDMTGSGLSRILGRFTRRHAEVSVHASVAQSLTLEEQIDRDELDLGVIQLFEHCQRTTDIVLSTEPLYWVKAPDLELDTTRPLPFVAFDDNCFYRRWAMSFGQSQLPGFTTVMTCASTAGVVSAVHAGLGVSLLNRCHLTPDMTIITDEFAPPPTIAYVIRQGRNGHAGVVRALVEEITEELGGRFQRAEMALS
ncbi:LysR family transcriptional regulator [Kushneria phosphatilytica]|uniref:LysR family transcriptional regulator n=1 Tax=Kushneria phosphatilytica TaxID=657387 RepID=A0A1S1NPY8_9GAMM|nr:LysR family transcriptional regulator [Kushneria phosphatilytica]OHV07543.1 LysR family transcriptional regulator [Kushneria phosphatilytica]QEL10029.1 LysR family transcriptional regulator [Kushneria phosphatilytica]